MRDIDQIITRFRDAGFKITPQRLSIFKLLKDNRNHPSAEDIYREILKIHPSISFTTVYKTLQTLRDMGEIQELTIDPERVHYDPEVMEHVHTFCSVCRSIGDLPEETHGSEFMFPSHRGTENFEVHQVQIHFVGVCGDCR